MNSIIQQNQQSQVDTQDIQKQIKNYQNQLEQKEQELKDQTFRVEYKDQQLKDQISKLNQRDQQLKDQIIKTEQKDQQLNEQIIKTEQKEQLLKEQIIKTEQKEQQLKDQMLRMNQKDEYLKEQMVKINQKDEQLKEQISKLDSQKQLIIQLQEEIETQYQQIQKQNEQIDDIQKLKDSNNTLAKTLEGEVNQDYIKQSNDGVSQVIDKTIDQQNAIKKNDDDELLDEVKKSNKQTQTDLGFQSIDLKRNPVAKSLSPNAKVPIRERDVPIDLEVSFKEIRLMNLISEGGYGEVYLAKWKELTVAVKMLKNANNKNAVRDFLTEIKAMQKLRHPNIVSFYGACTQKPSYALVMEYCKRGSLWNILQNRNLHLGWDERIRFATEISKACYYLHSFKPPIMHRDLKSLNILVDEYFNIKLVDFGWIKQIDNYMTGKIGTYQWMAPEVIAGKPYTESADVFSFGIILWEIAAREPPFRNINGVQVGYEVLNNNLRPKIPEKTPHGFKELIVQCWDRDPQKRPGFQKIIQILAKIQY